MRDVEIRGLHIDEWSKVHMWERHAISIEEAEEVCQGDFVALAGYKDRLLLVGSNASGNLLAVVVAPERDGIFYIVTARPASKKERQYYRQQKGQEHS